MNSLTLDSIAQVAQCQSAIEPLNKDVQYILIDAFLDQADSLYFGLEKSRFRRLMRSDEPPCRALAYISFAWGVRCLYARSLTDPKTSRYSQMLLGHETQFVSKAITYMQEQAYAHEYYRKMQFIQANILLGLHCFSMSNFQNFEHYASTAVSLSTEIRLNVNPKQIPTHEIYDFSTHQEHAKLFWSLFEFDCSNAILQINSHFFNSGVQISAPEPGNPSPGEGRLYTTNNFLQGNAVNFSSNFGKSFKVAFLSMWSDQLLHHQAPFTTSHPNYQSLIAEVLQTIKSLEALKAYPVQEKVTSVASAQIMMYALLEHLHLKLYTHITAVPADKVALMRAWAMDCIAKILVTVGEVKMTKYLKPHVAWCLYRCLAYEIHDVLTSPALVGDAAEMTKYKRNAATLIDALDAMGGTFPIASYYRQQLETDGVIKLLQQHQM